MTYKLVEDLVIECSNPNKSPFGQWINSLFSVVDNQRELVTFNDKKEVFFNLLEALINKGTIVVFPPEEFYKNGAPIVSCRKPFRNYHNENKPFDNVWDASSAEVIQYLRTNWPKEVTDSEDERLNFFWYSNHCPRIGWFDQDTNSVIAS